ncbi:b9 domain-containing protein 2 [Plasmopara halstedii]|uniref:B9 domain-containing protein 2 n=1 Tax=Plasmopara halstedii TaxID=4781 RepID=A0A0P1A4M6_PLAHL|nr:b9 domain-containing protein 2 [Plasmopara halstedii]CEG35498.1 b9 domain-containing protein 2 [Plasmopara halstedii]|eukprot:XP_024571867.1 b9 domain-containing protein 2 [Plasmopara halstedii]
MSGLRAAARYALNASQRSLRPSESAAHRAFMSTRASDTLFQTPSFSMPEDFSLKYPRADPSHMWKVGSFPLQIKPNEYEEGVLICSEDLWDTSGMLSSLYDNLPLREAINEDVDFLLRQMDGYLADSVLKKRRKKMSKHKHRKRRKALQFDRDKTASFRNAEETSVAKEATYACFNAPDVTNLARISEENSKPKGSEAKIKNKKNAAITKATAEGTGNEAHVADNAFKAPSTSPEKMITSKQKQEALLESDNEDKKKASSILTKKQKKFSKARLKRKLDDQIQEVITYDKNIEKEPLTLSNSDIKAEPTMRDFQWKIPDLKLSDNLEALRSQNKRIESFYEEKTLEPKQESSSSTNVNNVNNAHFPSRVRSEKGRSDKALLTPGGTGSSDSDQESQLNVLSPLRRHKAEFDKNYPASDDPFSTDRHQQRIAQLDVPPAYQPEVHLIGEIVSGHGFGTDGGITCKWRIEYGGRWIHIAGDQFGQTQLDYPSIAPWSADSNVVVWSHPIDLHFATSAFQGWPKLLFQVWRADSSMELHVAGYGFVSVPFAAGQHKLFLDTPPNLKATT